jgi:hypothetical protein
MPKLPELSQVQHEDLSKGVAVLEARVHATRQLEQSVLSLPTGPCRPGCSCHSLEEAIDSAAKHFGTKTAAASTDAPAGDSDSTDRHRLQLRCLVQVQQLCELAPVLLLPSKQLLSKGHSGVVVLKMADMFYRCVLLLQIGARQVLP